MDVETNKSKPKTVDFDNNYTRGSEDMGISVASEVTEKRSLGTNESENLLLPEPSSRMKLSANCSGKI